MANVLDGRCPGVVNVLDGRRLGVTRSNLEDSELELAAFRRSQVSCDLTSENVWHMGWFGNAFVDSSKWVRRQHPDR